MNRIIRIIPASDTDTDTASDTETDTDTARWLRRGSCHALL